MLKRNFVESEMRCLVKFNAKVLIENEFASTDSASDEFVAWKATLVLVLCGNLINLTQYKPIWDNFK